MLVIPVVERLNDFVVQLLERVELARLHLLARAHEVLLWLSELLARILSR